MCVHDEFSAFHLNSKIHTYPYLSEELPGSRGRRRPRSRSRDDGGGRLKPRTNRGDAGQNFLVQQQSQGIGR